MLYKISSVYKELGIKDQHECANLLDPSECINIVKEKHIITLYGIIKNFNQAQLY